MIFVVFPARNEQFADMTSYVIDRIVDAFNVSAAAANMRASGRSTHEQFEEASDLAHGAWDVVSHHVRKFSTEPELWN